MEAGGWVVAAGAGAAALAALVLRTLVPAWVSLALLAGAGAAIALGGMMLLEGPSTGEVVLAVTALVVLAPLHALVVLGRFGPRRPR